MPTWSPLLHDADAGRAMDAVRDVVAALTPDSVATSGWTLGGGAPGIALLHLALGEALGDADQTARGVALLEDSVDAVAEQRPDVMLFGSTLGLSLVLSRVGPRLGEDDPDESDADELVPRLLDRDDWPGHFDVTSGLAGIGAYCLERLPRPSARAGAAAVVAHLSRMAVRGPEGTAWYTTPAFYGPRSERFPDGHWDLGFAHGNAGVVAFLAAAARAGVDGAAGELPGAVRWLAARYSDGGDSAFPSVISPSGEGDQSRMAWCYGDPGVALALLSAGRALGDDAVVALARDTALRCAGRVDTSGIADASLCHGSAGVAHVFNRLGQSLGDERLLDLARYWFGRAVDDRRPEGIVAGFAGTAIPGTTMQLPTYGLVEGVAGTALALLTAATGSEPWWDFPLLIDATE